MDIENKDVLILGGSGLVGMAVAREMLRHQPRSLTVSALTRQEAERGASELAHDASRAPHTSINAEWGDVFLPESLRDRTREDVLSDPEARRTLLDDLLGELTPAVVTRSALGALLERRKPAILIDCVNTATAFAYQNIFQSAATLRSAAAAGSLDAEAVERHLATLYMPQLIRHVQIALEAMRRAGTRMYLKVGTAGTGGMGLNIPFTHSEERPSRMLLAKAGVAGAHTLLLYLMARTPDAPAVKEVKPTAAISWKRIAFDTVRRRGQPIERYDATRSVPVADAFTKSSEAFVAVGGTIDGVFLDSGENGLFSLGEFEALSALGLMEYITPEEIALDVVREITGRSTGRDVVGALDAATSGPTYRAGALREAALDRMANLERAHGVEAIAYEMLGPPRLSKLLFEAALLGRLFADLPSVAQLDPDDAARRATELIEADADLRVRMLSIGIPVLLPDGCLLRGPVVKVAPEAGQVASDPRLADNGWVDLRPANWRKWSDRARSMLTGPDNGASLEYGSRYDIEPEGRRTRIRPGRMAAWVFRVEDRGGRIKR
jgi:NAD(P)-dependent dehydrogenase (short-subunit alcohol dehydrogenase family)